MKLRLGDVIESSDVAALISGGAVIELNREGHDGCGFLIWRMEDDMRSPEQEHFAFELIATLNGIDTLSVENEALRKDAERYRWLKDNPSVEYGVLCEEEGPVFDVFRVTGSVNDREWESIGTGPTLDAAIDAAMKGQ